MGGMYITDIDRTLNEQTFLKYLITRRDEAIATVSGQKGCILTNTFGSGGDHHLKKFTDEELKNAVQFYVGMDTLAEVVK